jgi:hypothetical protein
MAPEASEKILPNGALTYSYFFRGCRLIVHIFVVAFIFPYDIYELEALF